MGPIAVFHHDTATARAVLERDAPDAQVTYVDSPDGLAQALAETEPEVAFTLKSAVFPGPVLRLVMACTSLRWVYVGGSGYDHLLPLDNPRIMLSNAAGVLAPHLAETTIGAMLALNGNLHTYMHQQRATHWQPLRFRPLAGQTLLVVGLGHIGAHVAQRARALGMRVLATRRSAAPHPDCDEVHPSAALPGLLARADVVSLHLRLDGSTRHLFDAAMLAHMRPGATLINTSRGPVVRESDLLAALDSGHVSAAFLDVFEQEPLPPHSPLWHHPRVLLTPHAGDNIHGWETLFLEHFAANLDRYRRGEAVHNRI